MKRLLTILFVVMATFCYAQPSTGKYTPINNGYNWLRGYFRALHLPAACGEPFLTVGQWPGAGAIYLDSCSDEVWYWSSNAWHLFSSSSGGQNIYNHSDSIVLGDFRMVKIRATEDLINTKLEFFTKPFDADGIPPNFGVHTTYEAYNADNGPQYQIWGVSEGVGVGDVDSAAWWFRFNTGSATFIDSRQTQIGIEYGSNYHGTYTNRSLVDKEYVDSLVDDVGSGSAAGLDRQLQFNNAGVFDGANVLYNEPDPGDAELGLANQSVTNGDGHSLTVKSGNGNGTGSAGSLNLTGGSGGATGNGGAVEILPGTGGATSGNGGAIIAYSGSANTGSGGNGGDLYLKAGSGDGAGVHGNIRMEQLGSGASSDLFLTIDNSLNRVAMQGIIPNTNLGGASSASAISLSVSGTHITLDVPNASPTVSQGALTNGTQEIKGVKTMDSLVKYKTNLASLYDSRTLTDKNYVDSSITASSGGSSFTETVERFTGSTSLSLTVAHTPLTTKARMVFFNGVEMDPSAVSISGTGFTISGITRISGDILTVKYSY